jgi:hypothetical protein
MKAVVATTNEDLATRAIANWRSIPYSFKKQILSTYEKNNFNSIFVYNCGC